MSMSWRNKACSGIFRQRPCRFGHTPYGYWVSWYLQIVSWQRLFPRQRPSPFRAQGRMSFHTSVMSSGETRFSFFKSGGPTATRSGFTNCQFGHLTVAADMPCASDRPLTTPITQQVTSTFVSGHFTIKMTVQYNFAAPVFLPLNFYSIQPDHSYVTITMPGEAHSG